MDTGTDRRDRNADEAFTLIELLVVVIIIGILAGIAIPLYVQQQTRSREAAAVATLRSAATYMEVTQASEEAYPTTVAPLLAEGFRPGRVTIADIDVSVSGNDYAIRGVYSTHPTVVACLRSTVGTPEIIATTDPCVP